MPFDILYTAPRELTKFEKLVKQFSKINFSYSLLKPNLILIESRKFLIRNILAIAIQDRETDDIVCICAKAINNDLIEISKFLDCNLIIGDRFDSLLELTIGYDDW